MDDAVRPRLAILRVLPQAGWGALAASLVVNVLLGAVPVAFILATSVMLGRVPAAVVAGVDSNAWTQLTAAFIAAAGLFMAQQVLSPLHVSLGELITRRVDGRVADRVIDAALGAPGIGPLEDQRLLDHLSEATRSLEQGWNTPGGACAGTLALIPLYVQLGGMALAVGVVFSWWAAAAVTLAVWGFRYGQRGGLRKYSRVWVEVARPRRAAFYFRALGVEADAAKEIRVFGLAGWLRERHRQWHMAWITPVWRERRRIFLKPFVVLTAFGLAVAAIVFSAIGRAAAGGELSLAQFAFAVQAVIAAIRLGESIPESDTQAQFGMRAHDALRSFEAGVREHAAQITQLSPRAGAQGLPRHAVAFEGVDFAYPGTDRLVLDELELEIPAGSATAIVGLNGAGKTTLVKLLGRLYEPTAGRITADGVDLRALALDDWRARIGIVFQDFNRYELSAADNIAFGAIDRAGDRDGIRLAAEQAGILPALERLPRGLDSPLSRQYDGGAELSGGQWQRIAIARALFAISGGASVLVLDEPTASLDVRAEKAFFDQFVDLTRGVTTILISHRFSSVRRADRIVVLSDGRVAEQGTHEQLLSAQGRYAQLFGLQAQRFTDERAELDDPQEAPA